MTSIFLTVQIVLAFLLTIVVLFQKSSSIGLGAYSGSNESVFGAKGPTNFLSRLTFIFGFLFVANTITLGYLYNQDVKNTVLDTVDKNSIIPTLKTISDKNEAELNNPEAPATPVVEEEREDTEYEIYDASTDAYQKVVDGKIVKDEIEKEIEIGEEIISIGEPKE
ncbi:protein translocase, SecG subunit [Thiovulum sp. ES]|nr:protein translocase, SecG subunit [Thiovulum sp. ES]